MAYIRLEADPDPVRVRAAWVSDEHIRAMADESAAALIPELSAIAAGAAA